MEYFNGLTKLYLELTIARTGSICCKIHVAMQAQSFDFETLQEGSHTLKIITLHFCNISLSTACSVIANAYCIKVWPTELTDLLYYQPTDRLTDWLTEWRPATDWRPDKRRPATNRLINRWQTNILPALIDWLNNWPQYLQFVSVGSSQLCYSCPKSASMEECDAQRTLYNCSMIGSFQTKCARFCDWKNGVHYRECAMDLKCERMQLKCEERMAMQDQKKEELECEYECCEGNLCNTDPCNLGSSIRPRLMSIVGAVFSMSCVITFCF